MVINTCGTVPTGGVAGAVQPGGLRRAGGPRDPALAHVPVVHHSSFHGFFTCDRSWINEDLRWLTLHYGTEIKVPKNMGKA